MVGASTYVVITAIACIVLSRDSLTPTGPPRCAGLASARVRRSPAVAVPAAVLVATAGFVLQPDDPPRLRVTVLDVGQGDAILIQTPDGADILVDGGPGPAVLRGLGDELPWHDRSIDLIVLTHPQADHLLRPYRRARSA